MILNRFYSSQGLMVWVLPSETYHITKYLYVSDNISFTNRVGEASTGWKGGDQVPNPGGHLGIGGQRRRSSGYCEWIDSGWRDKTVCMRVQFQWCWGWRKGRRGRLVTSSFLTSPQPLIPSESEARRKSLVIRAVLVLWWIWHPDWTGSMFKYFGEKLKVGNWPEIIHDVRTETRFLQDRGDSSQWGRC